MQKDEHTEHSLYAVGYWEIFWKNFLVGFARGLGGMVTYLLMLLIAYYAFFTYVMPKISPFLMSFQKAQENLERIQTPGSVIKGLFQKDVTPVPQNDSPNTR